MIGSDAEHSNSRIGLGLVSEADSDLPIRAVAVLTDEKVNKRLKEIKIKKNVVPSFFDKIWS
ncbi:MAG: hypothetical protein EOP48_01585 [Sphingobacteriales bacterium]|nr:MAG: hypothetical protein EOP48_01585 [Sphingobacteriales bacterium]